MLAIASAQRNDSQTLEAHRALGMILLWSGEFEEAYSHLVRGRDLYHPQAHRTHVVAYGNDPGVACLVHEAYANWFLGSPDRAIEVSDESIRLARELDHPFSLSQALIYRTYLHQLRREAALTRHFSEQAMGLIGEHGFRVLAGGNPPVSRLGYCRAGCTQRGYGGDPQGLRRFHGYRCRAGSPTVAFPAGRISRCRRSVLRSDCVHR